MLKRLASGAALLILLSLAGSVVANPVDGPAAPGMPRLWDPDSLVSTIRYAYERLEKYTRAGEEPLSFELSDFRTVQHQHFDTVAWADVETLESGDVLRMSRRSDSGLGWVAYVPRWYRSPQEYSPEQIKHQATLSYEAVVEHSDPSEELDQALALTSYEVRATFQGRSRVYRAAFLWYGDSEGQIEQIRVRDFITQGVELAMTDDVEPGGPELSEGLVKPSFQKVEGDCVAQTLPLINADTLNQGFSEHDTGSHQIFTQNYKLKCTCRNNCTQDAQLLQGNDQALDTGEILGGRCHRVSVVSIEKSCKLNQIDAHLTPAGCKYAVAAGLKSCQENIFGGCNCTASPVSVTLSGGQGLSAEFDFDVPPGVANLSSEEMISCNLCPADEGQGGTNGEPGTPILLNLDGGGFVLTGLEDPVWFDIDADGNVEKMGWTAAESGDAFLALDRNGNGRIDDGSELFGDAAAEFGGIAGRPSSARNGYSALAFFDIDWMGGNYDAVIDAEDEVFDSLLLWIDESHDGVSQPEELHSLASFGISKIELDYRESRRRDRHGNELRLSSSVYFEDGRRTQSVDVYFVTAADGS